MTTQQELEARYGETARASRTRWLAGLLVLGYVALITWAAIGLAGTEVEGNLVGWRADEREVAVDLEGISDRRLLCRSVHRKYQSPRPPPSEGGRQAGERHLRMMHAQRKPRPLDPRRVGDAVQ